MKLMKPEVQLLERVRGLELLWLMEYAARTCYGSRDQMTPETHADFLADKILPKIVEGRGHATIIEHGRAVVKVTCDRGVSHELVRHRIATYAQESTRWCNYSLDKYRGHVAFVVPQEHYPFVEPDPEAVGRNAYVLSPASSVENRVDLTPAAHARFKLWVNALLESERAYLDLLNLDAKPQAARGVLPNALKTEIVMNLNFGSWRNFFKQRTAPDAHPEMRVIACTLLHELQARVPVVFDDLKPDYAGPWATVNPLSVEDELRQRFGADAVDAAYEAYEDYQRRHP